MCLCTIFLYHQSLRGDTLNALLSHDKVISMLRPHIALIGPVAPLRGGIAQYTTQLHEALGSVSELQTVSFKRQYPGWLYPGASEKAPDGPQQVPGVRYELDVYNPFTWRRAADRIAKNGCDVAILDWWTLFWQPGFAYIARRLRRRGVKTVFLCHNLFDHDAHGLKRRLSELLLKQADAYIVQAAEQQALLAQIKPDAPSLLRIHPIYTRFPEPTRQLPRRGRLELLFFGFIRPYKGLDLLVQALARLHDSEVYLTVVGEPWKDADRLKQELLGAGVPNLELHLEYVTDAEAADYFVRADAVMLPYRSATGSGVVAVAYHYGKPVVATRVGGLQDAVWDGRTGFLVAPDSPDALAEAVRGLDRGQLTAMQPAIEQFCSENSWEAMAAAICKFAQEEVAAAR